MKYELSAPLLAGSLALLLAACGSDAAPKAEEAFAIPSRRAAQTEGAGEDAAPEEETTPASNDPEAAAPQTFSLSAEESLLYAQVWKDQRAWFSTFAHNHVVRATEWSGSVTYSPGDLTECAISFTLPVNSFENDESTMREFVGLEGTLSNSDRSTVHGHMLSEEQLNGEHFPTLHFQSTECLPEEEETDALTLRGDFTLRDQTRPVEVTAHFQNIDGHLYAQGTFEITHTLFGFEPYSAFFGSIKNENRIAIAFDVHGIPTPAEETGEDAPTDAPQP